MGLVVGDGGEVGQRGDFGYARFVEIGFFKKELLGEVLHLGSEGF